MKYLLHVSFGDGRLLPAESFIDCRALPTFDEAKSEARDLIQNENAQLVKIYVLVGDKLSHMCDETPTTAAH
jgi:hypothetical protein